MPRFTEESAADLAANSRRSREDRDEYRADTHEWWSCPTRVHGVRDDDMTKSGVGLALGPKRTGSGKGRKEELLWKE
jgi:hypothetical protein